jgi:S1-C subfamily serine protease
MRPLPLYRAVLLLLALVCPLGAAAGPAEASVWIDVARASGVWFNGYRLPLKGEGMGVVTPAREIATAAHVVWGAKVIIITDAKGAKVSARVERIDKDADVAILRVERRFEHYATVRVRPAALGERVAAVELRRVNGAVTVARGAIGATRWTSHGVPVPVLFTGIKGEKGMSGGGLFDERGELIGIIIRIDRTLGYLTALPVGELCTRFARCDANSQEPAEVYDP